MISADPPAADGVVVTRDVAELMAWLEQAHQRRFAWRRGHDCVSFALGAVKAQTGVDLLADIARWSSRAEALKVARSLGGLTAALDARMERVPAAMARRGDVASLPEEFGPDKAFGVRLAVVEGATLAGPATRQGGTLERLPRSAMAWAWDAGTAHRVAADEAGQPKAGPKAGGSRQ